ncbi:2TM domain-containing protein [uncultured Pseudacidovorax sp.]|uniref:2TM domain-containing protein n=1 Tax=uncultured Pseudacidovorax sp. TaxID=679313 RepID=UPI0025D888F5|nr:2TM domain-containing protein [uncultured Pseudacidovorax sp.]
MRQDAYSSIDALARRRAKAKLGWFAHAAIYTLVNLALIAVSMAHGRHWAVFPLLGWGLGLFFHGLGVWVFAPGNALMERMVQRERERLTADGRTGG